MSSLPRSTLWSPKQGVIFVRYFRDDRSVTSTTKISICQQRRLMFLEFIAGQWVYYIIFYSLYHTAVDLRSCLQPRSSFWVTRNPGDVIPFGVLSKSLIDHIIAQQLCSWDPPDMSFPWSGACRYCWRNINSKWHRCAGSEDASDRNLRCWDSKDVSSVSSWPTLCTGNAVLSSRSWRSHPACLGGRKAAPGSHLLIPLVRRTCTWWMRAQTFLREMRADHRLSLSALFMSFMILCSCAGTVEKVLEVRAEIARGWLKDLKEVTSGRCLHAQMSRSFCSCVTEQVTHFDA